jgi:uncharacterized protein involved in exopolysaccharide biosynthesis
MADKSATATLTVFHKHTHNLFRQYHDELRQVLSVLPEELTETHKQIVQVIKTLEEIRRIEERH